MSSLDLHIETTKRLAAHRQIDAAVAHLYKSELECAITLAAAAEGLLPDTDQPHIFAYLQNHQVYKNKEINFNDTITWLKHPSELDTKFIFEAEAAFTIARAMSKYAAVYNEGSGEWAQFLEWGVKKEYWKLEPPTRANSSTQM